MMLLALTSADSACGKANDGRLCWITIADASAGAVLSVMQSKSSPLDALPLMPIVALAAHGGSAPERMTSVPTVTSPFASGHFIPSQVIEPTPAGKGHVLGWQMLPVQVFDKMLALMFISKVPSVTASSTLPEPVTVVFCPSVRVLGERPVTLP